MMMEGTYDAYEKEQNRLKKQAKEEAKQKKMMAKLHGQDEEELEPIAQPEEPPVGKKRFLLKKAF